LSQHESTVNEAGLEESAELPIDAPVDLVADERNRGFTLRAVLTGMCIGSALSICNVYLGLKIGWGMNMSITAALLALGLWKVYAAVTGGREMAIGENNINQTGASAAAAISSAGLVAPIPAWTIITGQELSYPLLVLWVLSVGLVGVVVAIPLRRQLIEVDKLPFPGGIATGQTLKELYAKGAEAVDRVRMLFGGMALGAISKITGVVASLHTIPMPFSLTAGGAAATKVSAYTGQNLTFGLEPGLLMVAVGGFVGLRSSLSMLAGGVLAWGVLLPYALDQGWAEPGKPDAAWFSQGVKWLLWPGVAMMVTSSLTSFAFSWRSVGKAVMSALTGGAKMEEDPRDMPKRTYMAILAAVLAASSIVQVALFDIKPHLAVIGVLLSFLMAIVAGRVTGETNNTPVGAMGKVTQLTFGILDPGNVASNLMAANVTGGAASQCGDLLHDLKTGSMIGSWPRHQAWSQLAGVLGGAVVGSGAYMVLIPDPKGMLMTDAWAAPAVATWKAVAEIFANGISAMPGGSLEGMVIGGGVGVLGALAERFLPRKVVSWMPSVVSIGLAFTVQVYTSLAFTLGAVLMAVAQRIAPQKTAKYGIVICAGIVAGESLAGVGDALINMAKAITAG
jgi:putative OPT family oligopeptide transporter